MLSFKLNFRGWYIDHKYDFIFSIVQIPTPKSSTLTSEFKFIVQIIKFCEF